MDTQINKFRSLLARYDHENLSSVIPFDATTRKSTARHNAFDAALETANAYCAGTPAALLTGSVSAAVGVGKLAFGFFFDSFFPKSAQHRLYGSGLKLIAAGAAATVPGFGTYFNATLAAKDAADAANYWTFKEHRDVHKA